MRKMSLEEIAKVYGMTDYYDISTGKIFKLSQAIDAGDGNLVVPVAQHGRIIGYSQMKKQT